MWACKQCVHKVDWKECGWWSQRSQFSLVCVEQAKQSKDHLLSKKAKWASAFGWSNKRD